MHQCAECEKVFHFDELHHLLIIDRNRQVRDVWICDYCLPLYEADPSTVDLNDRRS